VRRRFRSKTLLVPVLLLSVFLVSGIAWAVTQGTLTFTGEVRGTIDCRLSIESTVDVNHTATEIAQADPRVSAMVDGATRNTLTFAAELDYQATPTQITFQVMNTGSCVMVLENLIINQEPTDGVVANWPRLSGMILYTGETTETQIITAQWQTNPTADATEIVRASIAYFQQI
jgi:hypothetical protein